MNIVALLFVLAGALGLADQGKASFACILIAGILMFVGR